MILSVILLLKLKVILSFTKFVHSLDLKLFKVFLNAKLLFQIKLYFNMK